MEYSIDRTHYRRSAHIEKEENEESSRFVYKILKHIIIQTMAGIIVFITAYTIKIMNLQPALDWLRLEVHREIPLSVAYDEMKNEIAKLYYSIMETQKEDEMNATEEKQEQPFINDKMKEQENTILSIHTDEPTEEIVYEEAVEGINQMSEDAKLMKSNYHFVYPIRGTITSRFGVRSSENPIVTPYHSGIDIAANTGTEIQAALSGKVITATTGEAYGKHIMIQTDDVITVYAHCSQLNVKEGQMVKQGDIIGKVGSTGWATGPHLHFEIRYEGRLVNPAYILDFGE